MCWYKGALAFVFMLLTACQWSPVYEKSDKVATPLTADVLVEPIPEETGRIIRQQLMNDLNPENIEGKKRYKLQVTVSQEKTNNVGIVSDNTATQAIMKMSAAYTLTDTKTKKRLLSSTARVASNYNILRKEPYATITAEENTKKSLCLMLADQIALQVAKTLKQLEK